MADSGRDLHLSLISNFRLKFKILIPKFPTHYSAMHHVGCMAALNLTWFRANSTL
jgi:hypothetical protein